MYGVKAAANDLTVKLSGTPRDDSDIAVAIAHMLDNNVQIPTGRVQARVQAGWVTLEGEVEHDFQRREVERMVRDVRGVAGVTNLITISAPVRPERVEEAIEDTFKREAEIDARHIKVEVSDHTAKLYGHVHSLKEANAATAAAASAPGVATVESRATSWSPPSIRYSTALPARASQTSLRRAPAGAMMRAIMVIRPAAVEPDDAVDRLRHDHRLSPPLSSAFRS